MSRQAHHHNRRKRRGPERRRDPTAARRKAEQRIRDELGRKQFKAEPRYDDLCEALRIFARDAEKNGNPALAKAIRAIRLDVDGWENDQDGMKAILTAIADEWSARWLADEMSRRDPQR